MGKIRWRSRYAPASVVRAGRADGSRAFAIQDSSAQVRALTPRKIFCHRTLFSSPAPRERGSGRDRSGQDRAALGRAAWEPRARRCSPGPSLSRDGRRMRRRDHRARVGGRSVAADTSGGPVGPVGPIAPYAPDGPLPRPGSRRTRSCATGTGGGSGSTTASRASSTTDRVPTSPHEVPRCSAGSSFGRISVCRSRSPRPAPGAANRWSSQPTTASGVRAPRWSPASNAPPTSGPVTKGSTWIVAVKRRAQTYWTSPFQRTR